MRFKSFLLSISVALFTAGTASAAPIDSATAGLASPDQLIEFDEVGGLVQGDAITNQFAALGVTFSPNLFYRTSFSGRDNFTTPALATFGSDLIDPFSIMFTSDVSAATFAFSVNFGTATFTALLDGVVQESFSSANSSEPPLFYGFSGFTFDEIQVQVGGNSFALIDNLSYNEIPLPAAFPLFLAGVAGVGFLIRRRRINA